MNPRRLDKIEAALRSAAGAGPNVLHVLMEDEFFYAGDPDRPVPFRTDWGGLCYPRSQAPEPRPDETWAAWDSSFESLAAL